MPFNLRVRFNNYLLKKQERIDQQQAKLRSLLEEYEKLLRDYPEEKAYIDAWGKENQKNQKAGTASLLSLERELAVLKAALEQKKKQREQQHQASELAKTKQAWLDQCAIPNHILDSAAWQFSILNRNQAHYFSVMPAAQFSKGKKLIHAISLPSIHYNITARKYAEEYLQIKHLIMAVQSENDKANAQQKVNQFLANAKIYQEHLAHYDARYESRLGYFDQLKANEEKLLALDGAQILFASANKTAAFLKEITEEDPPLALDSTGQYIRKPLPRAADSFSLEEKKEEPPTPSVTPHKDNAGLIQDFRQSRRRVMNQISELPFELDAKEDGIVLMDQTLLEHAKKADAVKKLLENRPLYLTAKGTVKREQKLDKYKLEDLQHWHQKTDHCWHGWGGTSITLGNQTFRVPYRIFNMMNVIAEDHIDKEAFNAALEKARKETSYNPFLSFKCVSDIYRASATENAYQTPAPASPGGLSQ